MVDLSLTLNSLVFHLTKSSKTTKMILLAQRADY